MATSFYAGPLRPNRNAGGNWYALTNAGALWTVETTAAACRLEAERITGEPWSKCSAYCEIRKVAITELGYGGAK